VCDRRGKTKSLVCREVVEDDLLKRDRKRRFVVEVQVSRVVRINDSVAVEIDGKALDITVMV
jgi:hypothetical protein